LRFGKKNILSIFSFVISIAIIPVIFSPYPNIDADLIVGTDSTLSPTISTLPPSSSILTTTDSTFQDIPAKTSRTLSPTISTLPPSSSILTTTDSTFQDIPAKTSRTLSPTSSVLSSSSITISASSNAGTLTSSTNPPPTTSTVIGSDEVFTPIIGMTTSTNPPPTTSTVIGSDEVFTPIMGVTISTIPEPTTSTVVGVSTPTVSIDDISIAEGNSGLTTFTFTVTRSDNTGAISVDLATADGTATTADNDYQAAGGTLPFSAGGLLSKTVAVKVIGDTKVEPDETFFVNLSNCVGCTIPDNQVQATIQNDDGPPEEKTLESECAKELEKVDLTLEGLFCIAITSIQDMLDMVKASVADQETRITDLENQPTEEIIRFVGVQHGQIQNINARVFGMGEETFFQRVEGDPLPIQVRGQGILAGKDGTITSFQYWNTNPVEEPTFRDWTQISEIYINGIQVASCGIPIGESGCTVDVSIPVSKTDILQMSVQLAIQQTGSGQSPPNLRSVFGTITIS